MTFYHPIMQIQINKRKNIYFSCFPEWMINYMCAQWFGCILMKSTWTENGSAQAHIYSNAFLFYPASQKYTPKYATTQKKSHTHIHFTKFKLRSTHRHMLRPCNYSEFRNVIYASLTFTFGTVSVCCAQTYTACMWVFHEVRYIFNSIAAVSSL